MQFARTLFTVDFIRDNASVALYRLLHLWRIGDVGGVTTQVEISTVAILFSQEETICILLCVIPFVVIVHDFLPSIVLPSVPGNQLERFPLGERSLLRHQRRLEPLGIAVW